MKRCQEDINIDIKGKKNIVKVTTPIFRKFYIVCDIYNNDWHMRRVTVKVGDKKAIEKTCRILRRHLKKGDIILTGPIPLNFKARFLNIVSMVSRRVLRGITHACIYLGEGYVLENDSKFIVSGPEIERIKLETFVKRKIGHFGGVNIYIVTSKYYNKYYRNRVIEESINGYLDNNDIIKHSYVKSLFVGIRYVFFKNKHYPEDLSFKDKVSCGEIVASVLKRSGVKIGKKATYNFVPTQFAFSKHFRVKGKVSLK